MEYAVKLAKADGVSIGAHPGFPDLVGFGRRNMNVSPKEAKAMVQYQIGALDSFWKTRLQLLQGKDIPIKVDSICVHGDGDKALEFVEKIKLSLEEENIEIIPLHKIY